MYAVIERSTMPENKHFRVIKTYKSEEAAVRNCIKHNNKFMTEPLRLVYLVVNTITNETYKPVMAQ
jgi:hypothetical protein